MSNPLLRDDTLPLFDEIKPSHVLPAIEVILTSNRQLIKQITRQSDPAWDNLITPLEVAGDKLHRAWSPVCHLYAVMDSPEWRQAYHAALPLITTYETEISQHTDLYRAYRVLSEHPAYQHYDQAQKQVIQNALRDFRLSGVDLPPEKKATYRELSQALSSLTSQYSDHVLDATQAWTKQLNDVAQLKGLPAYTVEKAANKAKALGKTGWVLTLDFPCYESVMRYAADRAVREAMYRAYCTRGSDQGEHDPAFDNTAIMQAILEKRQQLAELLGFAQYADYSLATKMAESSQAVMDFLSEIIDKTKPVAIAELETLKQFAKQCDNVTLAHWDVAYYSEKQRQATYALDQDALRAYFPLDNVFKGMFEIVRRLYGIEVVEESTQAWHPTVKLFAIYDKDKQLCGKLYTDLFARENKRGGAWMDECLVRRKKQPSGEVQHPVAYLVCNFNAPLEDQPSLLTHEEVETLLHEFGHCLHHVLTQIDYADVSGINGVAWDAVELPSQFMENWAWQKESLALLCSHYETGEPLPEAMCDNLLRSQHYQSAMQLMRQMTFALFDFQLHLNTQMPKDHTICSVLTQVQSRTALMPVLPYNRFTHSFSHIFAGGYAAGYYGYAWADVLAADAFSLFLKAGIFDRQLGERFLHCLLEKGGSQPALALFMDFCGHRPQVDALLKARGILS